MENTIRNYAELIEPDTLRLERKLPGSLERVWQYLTNGELRRQWLAAGEMELSVGARFELVWRNDELTVPPGTRPESFGVEHRMQSVITTLEAPQPPHGSKARLSFTWQETGEVCFELDAVTDGVLLRVTHKRLPSGTARTNIATGWHSHLDLLTKCVAQLPKTPFWDEFRALRSVYAERFAASASV